MRPKAPGDCCRGSFDHKFAFELCNFSGVILHMVRLPTLTTVAPRACVLSYLEPTHFRPGALASIVEDACPGRRILYLLRRFMLSKNTISDVILYVMMFVLAGVVSGRCAT